LIAVDHWPDVDRVGSRLGDFRKDFFKGRVAVKTGAEDISRLPRGIGFSHRGQVRQRCRDAHLEKRRRKLTPRLIVFDHELFPRFTTHCSLLNRFQVASTFSQAKYRLLGALLNRISVPIARGIVRLCP
jgi:hypothetical protein